MSSIDARLCGCTIDSLHMNFFSMFKSIVIFVIRMWFCRHQRPIELPERWVHDKYSTPNNPFIIDIGCSKGMWATSYAQQNPNKNVLGVDIRQPVIDMALARCENMKLSNIHFLRSNANVDISKILAGISDSCASGVEMITIQTHTSRRGSIRGG